MLYVDDLIAIFIFPGLASDEDSQSGILGSKGGTGPCHTKTGVIPSKLEEITVQHTDKLAHTRDNPSCSGF